ncbi:MAG: hypothetical protein JST85_28560 [Acidobacteria bacterium]|nr:hypothetical protein [Acidobacteriota bacterium]
MPKQSHQSPIKHAYAVSITLCCGVVSVFWVFWLSTVSAEQLPVRTYTTADGLLRDEVRRIRQDSRGFLWFCTADGVSRFDGYGFTNYTTDDGLPHRTVNDLIETRAGAVWIATENGLARFNPKGKRGAANLQPAERNPVAPMFVSYWPEEKSSRNITVLLEDAQEKLWCGTDDGLYWFEESNGRGVFHRLDLPKERSDLPLSVLAIIQDQRQNLWVGMDFYQGLNRITPKGDLEHYQTRREHRENEAIVTLLETREGEIWAGMSIDGGLCSLASNPDLHHSIFSRCYGKKDGLPTNWISSLYQSSDGKLWIGTTDGTASFDPASAMPQFRVYRAAQGLSDESTFSLCEDGEGNLWLATSRGVKKITRSGFVRYAEDDGLAQPNVVTIFASHTGELFVITKQPVESADRKGLRGIHLINRFDGVRFTSVTPNIPSNVGTGWGGGQIVISDQEGRWWFPSDKKAAYLFPKVSRLEQLSSVQPRAVPIPDAEVFRLYEDSHHNIWIGTMYSGRVLIWERRTEKLRDYTDKLKRETDLPADAKVPLTCFTEDDNGTLWAGFYNHSCLMRYRAGQFALLPINGEHSDDATNSLYFDRTGRLWLASRLNGVGRIDDPNAAQLKVVWYNRRSGLATDSILGLTEDNSGRLYVTHGRGVDRINPNTGQIKHYTSADGLPQGVIQFTTRDAQGSLWFGGHGLARLVPEPDKPRQAPTILLTGLRVASVKQPVSELGEEHLPALTLEASQTQVGVDFLGLGASLGEELKYQYKLEGAQNNWSEPTPQRTVDFANLAPGAYRFLVKAITAEGTESQKPAVFAFTILRPVWQRTWFLLMAITTLALMLYALYRYRVGRLVELERVRTRIATDLHDDIGSNLSLIAMLSEVTLRTHGENTRVAESLSQIAGTARELVDSMSDIVWAVNPQKDNVRDLTKRMRRFASEVFSARNIVFKFSAPDEEQNSRLDTDTRREVFLIFKEAINNIARHSECTMAEIELQVATGWLTLTLRDNGKGFDTSATNDGNGLMSMRQRAEKLGGKFEASSGGGTTVIVKVPLGRRG